MAQGFNLGFRAKPYLNPNICRIFACGSISTGFGILVYLLLGSRLTLRVQGSGFGIWDVGLVLRVSGLQGFLNILGAPWVHSILRHMYIYIYIQGY